MADKSGLGFIGLLLGAATLLVTVIGATVVTDYASGGRHIDDGVVEAHAVYAAR